MADKEAPKNDEANPETVSVEAPKKELSKSEKKAAKAEKDKEFNAANTVHVKVYSPFQTYYDDEAESITAENSTGPFDILPRHHNFITLLMPCELDIKSAKGGDKKIAINRGVMHVTRNSVTVFLDV